MRSYTHNGAVGVRTSTPAHRKGTEVSDRRHEHARDHEHGTGNENVQTHTHEHDHGAQDSHEHPHSPGSPMGVIPPYSMPVSPVAVSIEANEALRAPS